MEHFQLSLDSEIVPSIEDSKIVTLKFVPSYQSAGSYSLTGTAKFGSEAEREITGIVRLPEYCSVFSGNCEKLNKQTPATIPNPSSLERTHYVEIRYTNQQNPQYLSAEVGYRIDTKKVQLYLGYGVYGSSQAIRLDPPSTP